MKFTLSKSMVFFSIATILISLAFFSIKLTFAYDNHVDSLNWHIMYQALNKTELVDINSEKINIKVNLNKDTNEHYLVNVYNKGDIDAILKRIEMSSLNDEMFGNYRLGEFFDFKITYYQDNLENNVKENASLNPGDILKQNTYNTLSIKVKIKDNLSQDKKGILENINTTKTLFVITNYQQM